MTQASSSPSCILVNLLLGRDELRWKLLWLFGNLQTIDPCSDSSLQWWIGSSEIIILLSPSCLYPVSSHTHFYFQSCASGYQEMDSTQSYSFRWKITNCNRVAPWAFCRPTRVLTNQHLISICSSTWTSDPTIHQQCVISRNSLPAGFSLSPFHQHIWSPHALRTQSELHRVFQPTFGSTSSTYSPAATSTCLLLLLLLLLPFFLDSWFLHILENYVYLSYIQRKIPKIVCIPVSVLVDFDTEISF